MAVVHDLAEAIVGDIAPSDGVPKETKARLEAVYYSQLHPLPILISSSAQDAMHTIVHEMLNDSPAAQRIHALWIVHTISDYSFALLG